jgi:DNA polymerase-4
VIAPGRVESFLRELPVEALWGVGPVTAKKLRALGIQKLVDVREKDEITLQKAVGSLAATLKRLSWGEDLREVKPDRPWKSISAETTFAVDLESLDAMKAELAALAQRVAASLQKKKLLARTVTLKLRYRDFTTVTRNHTGTAPTRDAGEFVARAIALLERTDAARRPVRLLGVGAHGLLGELAGGGSAHPGQLLLE